jgi:hypothetical protein
MQAQAASLLAFSSGRGKDASDCPTSNFWVGLVLPIKQRFPSEGGIRDL